MKHFWQRAIAAIVILLTCWWGNNLGILTEEMRSPIAIAEPTPPIVLQILKDPESLIRVSYTSKTATEFAWRTFLALYVPECAMAPTTDKQAQKGILYLTILLLLYEILPKKAIAV